MLEDLYYLFQMTIEVWVFLAILMVYMIGEELYNFIKNRNDQVQDRVNKEVDRLHR